MTSLQEHLHAYLLQITDTPVHREPVDDSALIARLRAQYEDAVRRNAIHLADAVADSLDYDTDGH